jgi:predicted transcriptional regulator
MRQHLAYPSTMAEVIVTFNIEEDALRIIDEIAVNMELDRAAVLRDALTQYLASYRKECAEAEEAMSDIEAGNFYTHEQVMQMLADRKRKSQAA